MERNEVDTIDRIADRASAMATEYGFDYRKADAFMDLSAAKAIEPDLDLDGLLLAGDGDFGHDVFGIRRYLDRENLTLTDCFLPRYARR